MKSPLRLFVTGTGGQVVTALEERCGKQNAEVFALGLPDLDLTASPEVIEQIVGASAKAMRADAIANVAAYTAVDKAENEPDIAMAINGVAAGAVARAAASLNIPVIHISTDYVFDGSKSSPWVETDTVNPINSYGRTKLAGELAVSKATSNHAILRTSWVYAPYGANFVRTMLRLAEEGKTTLTVVADQVGSPTSALDIADAILNVARNLVEHPDIPEFRGIFHMAASGETSWADFARAIFEEATAKGVPFSRVVDVPSSDYKTAAKRPANSRLNTKKLSDIHKISFPDWRQSMKIVLDRLLSAK